MQFSFEEAAAALGLSSAPGGTITGWSVDSRTVQPGDLFFALRGPNHDGNQYVQAALDAGAIGAVAETQGGARVLQVPDALAALQRIAAWARGQWGGSVIGVTGSAGKTSTKDAIAELLPVGVPAGRSEGNLNNHIGVPLSLLRLDPAVKAAVIEIGMNHAGEIRALSAIASPSVAVVTNVGAAHLETFGSLDAIALAKRELVEALPPDGVAVLNADDPRVAAFARVHPGRSILYGLSSEAEVCAQDIELGAGATRFRVGPVRFETWLPGRHGIRNILAALAVASLYGIGPDRLVGRVRTLRPGKMRGERILHNGILILNDCYNSNPDAARAMLDLLADMPAQRRIAVLGEMLELGRWSESLHRDLGSHAAKSGLAVLIGVRGAARAMVDAAMNAGMQSGAAVFFDEPVPAGDYARSVARAGDVMLFKGSRGTQMERALERMLA